MQVKKLAKDAKRACLVAPWLLAASAMACGQTSSGERGAETTSGAAGGPGGSSSAGSPPGGSDAGVGGGAGGAGGNEPRHVPGETEEEGLILEPLFDDSTVDGLHGDALVDFAGRVGLARGYALCRCALSAKSPPESPSELIRTCARDESGQLGRTLLGDGARCLSEALAADPALEATVRCEIRREVSYGRAWLDACWQALATGMPEAPPIPDAVREACPRDEDLQNLLLSCQLAHYCPDGTRSDGARCDATIDCVDGSDEHACFEFSGRDMLQCGDEILDPRDVCLSFACQDSGLGPWCDETRPQLFRCDDGTEVTLDAICDRIDDCADQTDERYCLR